MKAMVRFFSSTFLIGAIAIVQPSFANGIGDMQQGNRKDTINTAQTMRVVFLPGSTSKNFRIGIEADKKCDINIQVINDQGMVVYSDVVEKVTKKVEERDFSWLKRGEYTVKVMNQDSEYTKKLVL